MSIRVRLVLSYIAMLLVPLVLFGLAVIFILVATFGSLKSGFDVDFSQGNPIKRVIDQETENVAYMKARIDTEPDVFLDEAFVKDLNERFHKINMGVIIRKDQTITYLSSYLKEGEAGDTSKLPVYGTPTGKYQRNQGSVWITRQQDFTFSDRSKGTVFVFLDGGPFQKYLHRFSKTVIVAFILILIGTNGVLTYFVSRSIIRPLRALKQAAEHIKEGNLDFEIKPHRHDELGELSIAFEEMRRKLKQSVDLQLQYEENRKELMSNISHDLKTPVTAIKGYVEGIMDGVTNSPDKLDKYIRTIYNKAVDMDRMIDELFLFAKLDLGKVPFQFETVDLGEYVQDCSQELQLDMEKKGVQFTLADLPQEPMLVTADRDKLRRVLLNIIDNAMKYSEAGRCEITLSVLEQSGFAIIQVKDKGQGISEEALPHIFDRFYRADPSRNTATGGSGLGLAIAKQIMEEHGGRIGATSRLGQGTTVYLALPLHTGKGSEA